MEKKGAVRRFEGPQAVQKLLRQMKNPIGQRPKIRIFSYFMGKPLIKENVVVCNYVLKDTGELPRHWNFQIADLFKSKSGQPLPIRFVYPPEHADPWGKDLYPLEAIEVPAS